MNSKLMSADEKRDRKNAMTRIRRANGKNSVMDTEMPEPESYSVPEPEPESQNLKLYLQHQRR